MFKAQDEDQLTRESLRWIFGGFLMGFLISVIFGSSLNFGILITCFFMIIGLFVISGFQFYKLTKHRNSRVTKAKSFHWGVELNLRKLQINYNKSLAMLQFAGLLCAGLLVTMGLIAKDYPVWNLGHQIFFPLCAFLFVAFLHLSFRWWFILREGADYLQIYKGK